MKPLYETYRPASWNEVVGQDKAVSSLLTLNSRSGFGGKAFWITGLSGSGKTCLARLIASEVADPEYIEEIDAETLTPSRVQEIEYDSQYSAFGKGGRAYLVNEAHGLKTKTVRQLLVTLERIPKHVTWVFTTTVDGQEMFDGCEDSGPLMSRCMPIHLARRGIAEPMAQRLVEVSEREGFGKPDVKAVVKSLYDCKLNMRAAFQRLEMGVLA